MTLHFTYEFRDSLKSFSLFRFVKTITKLVMEHSVKFEIQILKIIRCGSRPPHDAEFGRFTLLFYRGRQEMFQDLLCTCTAIVLLIKPFVSRRSRYLCRRGFLKLPCNVCHSYNWSEFEYTSWENSFALNQQINHVICLFYFNFSARFFLHLPFVLLFSILGILFVLCKLF